MGACGRWKKKLLKKNCIPRVMQLQACLYIGSARRGRFGWINLRKVWFKGFDIKCTYCTNVWGRGVARSREAAEWHGGKGVCPNASVYNMLIKGFRKVGNAREGIRVLKGMLDDECLLNKSTYSILIEGLYESGLEEKFISILSMASSGGGLILILGMFF